MSAIIPNSPSFSIRRRNLLVATVAILISFLVAVGANGLRFGDLGVFLWAVFGIVFGVTFIRQLRLESRILTNPTETSATVLRVWPGYRRGFRINYEFVAGDGKQYMGSAAAPRLVPNVGQKVAVIYRRGQPMHSLPRQQFWLHELESGS